MAETETIETVIKKNSDVLVEIPIEFVDEPPIDEEGRSKRDRCGCCRL